MKKVSLMLFVFLTMIFGSISAQDAERCNQSASTLTTLELSEVQKMQMQAIQNQYVLALVEAAHGDDSVETKRYLKACWEKRNRAIKKVLTQAQFENFIKKEVKPAFLIELEQLEATDLPLDLR